MSQEMQRDQISKKKVVYTMPAMEAVMVRRDEPYRVTDTGALTMDLYYPPATKAGVQTPAVIFVTGYSDLGAEKLLGSRFKDMGSFVSWAQLVAACGLVGITYANREPGDVYEALHHVQQNATSLGIDARRIGVWACSGHGPNALSVLMERGRDGLNVRCWPMPTRSTSMARPASPMRQNNSGLSRLPRVDPSLISRAISRYSSHVQVVTKCRGSTTLSTDSSGAALAMNLPVTVTNHATGPHAFDVVDDTRTSRDIIRQVLAFLQFHLST